MSDIAEFETYSDAFSEYLDNQDWITPAELPLVHHVRRLCKELDAVGLDKAALASAYIQGIERLERRRPRPAGAAGGIPGDLPGQTSIFDELDDD